jgi:hypothetical protein
MFAAMPKAVGGEPANTPEKSAAKYEYPPVHDIPAPRVQKLMTDQQRREAETAMDADRAKRASLPPPTDINVQVPANRQ